MGSFLGGVQYTNAQTYTTSFDDAASQTGWTVSRKGHEAISSIWDFTTASTHTGSHCLSHHYPVGGNSILDDWFVSPEFDFSFGGSIDSIWHHFSGFSTPTGEDTIAIYLLVGSPDPDLAASKTILLNYNDNYVADNTWTLNSNIVIPQTTSGAYIAIRYKTIVSWLDVKFDDITISQVELNSIPPVEPSQTGLVVYPNPSKGHLFVLMDNTNATDLKVYSIQGQLIQSYTEIKGSLDLNLETGTYLIRSGNSIKKVIIIE